MDPKESEGPISTTGDHGDAVLTNGYSLFWTCGLATLLGRRSDRLGGVIDGSGAHGHYQSWLPGAQELAMTSAGAP